MVPIAQSPVTCRQWLACAHGCWGHEGTVRRFADRIARTHGCARAVLTASGNTALALLLQALQEESGRRQVVLSAYTHGSVGSLLSSMGLEPVLVDVSSQDFIQSHERLTELCTSETLCVVVSHPFGLVGYRGLGRVESLPCPVIEDVTQALGSRWRHRLVGGLGRAAWLSFGRGDNFSTEGGGAVLTSDHALADRLEQIMAGWPEVGGVRRAIQWGRIAGLHLATRPWWYKAVWWVARRNRVVRIAEDFPRVRYSPLQAAYGESRWDQLEWWSAKRWENTLQLMDGLKSVKGVGVPDIAADDRPALNRFPLLVRHHRMRRQVLERLWAAGIEAALHYAQPLHKVFALGYGGDRDPFPHATYLAERIITLPVHPEVQSRHLARIIEVVKKICG